MLRLSKHITTEIMTLFADRCHKVRTKPKAKRVCHATNDSAPIKAGCSAHVDNKPSNDEDATARAIRDKLGTLLKGQPPNVFATRVYAQASADGNPAEVISAVLNGFTMLDHKSSLKFFNSPLLPWFKWQYKRYSLQTEEPLSVWTQHMTMDCEVAHPDFNPAEFGERTLCGFVRAAFKSLEEQVRLQVAMCTAYMPKRASRVSSPSPHTEAHDQHATPDMHSATPKQASTGAWGWGQPPRDWDDGEGHRWGTAAWIPGEWGSGSWGGDTPSMPSHLDFAIL
ncbi:uncharacterized protein ARMOST_20465 [Armillaria ostoyae]|uniref:Uncharacterized protein n=1 Tax=Armillaria ostoyae TaxID=47428 RepID=A0A284S7G3_ARMOS|nr:uncharacterized protein ARMOST_20465 [Armillaria ostoyae]